MCLGRSFCTFKPFRMSADKTHSPAGRIKKPDRVEGVAARRLLDALGTARQAVISTQTQVKVAGPVYHGCQMVTSALDATSLPVHPVTFMRRAP
jgi:hypothetical protein